MDDLWDEYYAARHSSDTIRKVRARQAIEEAVAPAAVAALKACLMRDRSITGGGEIVDRLVELEVEQAELRKRLDQYVSGTLTNCPIEGVHEHVFRGPHRFREWEPGT